jgi:hypothetical protein
MSSFLGLLVRSPPVAMELLWSRMRGASSNGFVQAAIARGIPAREAVLLEPAARVISPERPEEVLRSRELLEKAALRAVLGDGGNLELSFRCVDALARVMETLNLTRASDVLDPFRRAWILAETGRRAAGVVLSCQGTEIAVLCPADAEVQPDGGHKVKLQYRSFSSIAEFPLQLSDACRFPGGVLLHLKRPGGGAIGRAQPRYAVRLDGQVSARAAGAEVAAVPAESCVILDLSTTGAQMKSATGFAKGRTVRLVLSPFNAASGRASGGASEPFVAEAVVARMRPADQGGTIHALAFSAVDRSNMERLERFLATLQPPVEPMPAPAEPAS